MLQLLSKSQVDLNLLGRLAMFLFASRFEEAGGVRFTGHGPVCHKQTRKS